MSSLSTTMEINYLLFLIYISVEWFLVSSLYQYFLLHLKFPFSSGHILLHCLDVHGSLTVPLAVGDFHHFLRLVLGGLAVSVLVNCIQWLVSFGEIVWEVGSGSVNLPCLPTWGFNVRMDLGMSVATTSATCVTYTSLSFPASTLATVLFLLPQGLWLWSGLCLVCSFPSFN